MGRDDAEDTNTDYSTDMAWTVDTEFLEWETEEASFVALRGEPDARGKCIQFAVPYDGEERTREEAIIILGAYASHARWLISDES